MPNSFSESLEVSPEQTIKDKLKTLADSAGFIGELKYEITETGGTVYGKLMEHSYMAIDYNLLNKSTTVRFVEDVDIMASSFGLPDGYDPGMTFSELIHLAKRYFVLNNGGTDARTIVEWGKTPAFSTEDQEILRNLDVSRQQMMILDVYAKLLGVEHAVSTNDVRRGRGLANGAGRGLDMMYRYKGENHHIWMSFDDNDLSRMHVEFDFLDIDFYYDVDAEGALENFKNKINQKIRRVAK